MLQAEETFIPIDVVRMAESERRIERKSMPITISEAPDISQVVRPERRQRAVSLPTYLSKPQSIMKHRTLDESLHSLYGSEDGMIRSRKPLPLRFDKINVREYSRTVGDNPSCSSGPPISISWEYNVIGDIDLEEYESTRPARRLQRQMAMPRRMREEMLRYEWDVSRKEITESIRQNVKIKNQRRTTINNLGKATKFEEAIESLGRKLKRFITFKKSVKKQVKDLEDQIDATQRRRSKLIYLDQAMSQDGEESALTLNRSGHFDHGTSLKSHQSMSMKSMDGQETAPSEKSPLALSRSGDSEKSLEKSLEDSLKSHQSMTLKSLDPQESVLSEKLSIVLIRNGHAPSVCSH